MTGKRSVQDWSSISCGVKIFSGLWCLLKYWPIAFLSFDHWNRFPNWLPEKRVGDPDYLLPEHGAWTFYLRGEDGGTCQSCFSTLRLFPKFVTHACKWVVENLCVDFWTWWISLYGQRGGGEGQDWGGWKKSSVKIQDYGFPIHLMLLDFPTMCEKHFSSPQLPWSWE